MGLPVVCLLVGFSGSVSGGMNHELLFFYSFLDTCEWWDVCSGTQNLQGRMEGTDGIQ